MIKKSFIECFRTPIKYAVLILIFSVTFTVLCFAVNYDHYVQSNITEIDKSFTTIVVPDSQAIINFLPDPYEQENGYLAIDYEPEADFYLSLRHFVEASKYGILDNSELLRGVCNNVSPVLSGAFDPLEYNVDEDSPRNSAAFIVTVMDVEYSSKAVFDKGITNSGGGIADSAHYVVKFRVDETIVLNPCYQAPEFLYVSSGAFTTDMRCPFEDGKQYFISGAYEGIRVIQKERENGTPFPDTYYDFDENSVPSIYLDGSNFSFATNIIISGREAPVIKDYEVNGEATTAYTYSEKELLHMCVAYGGNLDKLLAERIDIVQRLESANANAYSTEIRTTDNLNSVLYFNQGKASIMVGRNFTEKEITSGAHVCVVSESFATFNNLKVGDSFNVDLYNPIMRRLNGGAWLMYPYHDMLNPLKQDKEISRGNLELNVVGIYITLPWEYSAYSLNYNTVFIPSNAVPKKLDVTLPEKTEDLEETERISFSWESPHMIPALFTVIIPNDKLNDFQAEANAAGFGDYFIYNDQGYSEVKDTLPLIAGSTHVFMIVTFVGFLSVFVLYITLLPHKRYELGMLLSIGAKRSEAVMSIVFGWLVTVVPALILCFIAVTFSGDPLAKAVLNSTMNELQYNDAFSAGAQDSSVDLSGRFGSWTNDYAITLIILLGIFTLYLVTALIIYIWQSKQSVLELLRRNE